MPCQYPDSNGTDLEREANPLPRGSIDLGDSYVLLRAMDTTAQPVSALEAVAINAYLRQIEMPEQANPHVVRWACLWLPNGQVARSAWKELLKPLTKLRMTRNVKVSLLKSHNELAYGWIPSSSCPMTIALLSGRFSSSSKSSVVMQPILSHSFLCLDHHTLGYSNNHIIQSGLVNVKQKMHYK